MALKIFFRRAQSWFKFMADSKGFFRAHRDVGPLFFEGGSPYFRFWN